MSPGNLYSEKGKSFSVQLDGRHNAAWAIVPQPGHFRTQTAVDGGQGLAYERHSTMTNESDFPERRRMPNEEIPDISGRGDQVTEPLRDANQPLPLQALQAHEAAKESARRYQDQQHVNEVLLKEQRQLRSLASDLMLTEQRERKRLATELHDYVGQMMVLGRLKVGQIRFQVGAADSSTSHMIQDLDDIFTKSLAYIRTLMAELIPPALYELGLPSALRWLAEETRIRHQLTVDVHLAEEPIQLPDDQALFLFQTVRKLLLNLVQHAGTSHAAISLTAGTNNHVRIVVKDHSPGVNSDFHETKSEATQLLSIRERMEAMGGSLHVDSGPDTGMTITLELALAGTVEEEAGPPVSFLQDRRPITTAEQSLAMRRLLLVDDHAMVREGLRAILEDYEDLSIVGLASNGVEAVSMAVESNPDVILMDVNMPEMDGIEATKRIKAARPAAIVIGLSVNNSPPVMAAMKEAGAAAFVSKDAAGEQLYDAIAALTRRPPKFLEPKAA